MRTMTPEEVHAQKIEELGLDASALDLTSTEGLAAAIRRAASFLCPCPTATLVRAVVRPLLGLVDKFDSVKALTEDTLEAIIAHGDIMEQTEIESDSVEKATLLYAAPPSFVERETGTVIIIGIASDKHFGLPEHLSKRIESINHLRRLKPAADGNLVSELLQCGLMQLSEEIWQKQPTFETAVQHVEKMNQLLDKQGRSGEVPGLILLDPEQSVTFYRGRWAEPNGQTGRFVARRSRSYGAPLWCYVEMHNGRPQRFIDFPIGKTRWRGCDEAWRLQMAIDAQRKAPQQFKVRSGPDGTSVIEFFSPMPMWAKRRWDAVGEPVACSGCLFAYRFPDSELGAEVRWLLDPNWMQETSIHTRQT